MGNDEYFDVGGFQLKPDGTYQTVRGSQGRYSYVSSTRRIEFSTGHYADTGVTASYYPNGPAKGGIPGRHDPAIVLRPRSRKDSTGMGHNEVQYCYLQAGALKDQNPPSTLPKAH